tara:strand:- start:88 stop:627 length:540 start_codon:yes stop_codon:yes gene_type:complete
VKYRTTFLHCSDLLQDNLKTEIDEIYEIIRTINWQSEFIFQRSDKDNLKHQTAYNERFKVELENRGWESQPKLSEKPRLIGDFRKNLVFGEIQFGNSATLYRDFYKFQYGVQNGLVSLNILITPVSPSEFFPTRPDSVANMAEYDLALRYFSVLPISVPTLVIGLEPEPAQRLNHSQVS